jgi:hypothetical protein
VNEQHKYLHTYAHKRRTNAHVSCSHTPLYRVERLCVCSCASTRNSCGYTDNLARSAFPSFRTNMRVRIDAGCVANSSTCFRALAAAYADARMCR